MSDFFIFPITIEPTETGGFLATSEELLPGFLVEGESIEEVLREAPVVAQALIEVYRKTGKPLPAELQTVPEQFTIQILVPA